MRRALASVWRAFQVPGSWHVQRTRYLCFVHSTAGDQTFALLVLNGAAHGPDAIGAYVLVRMASLGVDSCLVGCSAGVRRVG